MSKYKPGMKIGPKNVLFIEEIEPYISETGKTRKRQGRFLCPDCQNIFEARIDFVTKKSFKGCPSCSRKLINTIDLTGQRFGRLVVIAPTDKRCGTGVVWKCQCDCGNISYPNTQTLKSGHAKSCGCLQKEIVSTLSTKNLIGLKFGKLTVLEKGPKKDKLYTWKCKCECGNICYVKSSNLINGRTISCGCIKSKGELRIKNLLIKEQIIFYSQWTGIPEKVCKNPKTNSVLYFDFYLPEYNCCIEFDGKQHFEYYLNGFYDENNYKEIKYRDNIKDQYCKNNNIKLIRIPYNDYEKIDIKYLLEKVNNA